MKVRSVEKFDLAKTDKVLQNLSWIFLTLIWLMTIFIYQTLPNKIPTHFNFKGSADNFGSKEEIFILPIIGTVLTLGLTLLNSLLGSPTSLKNRRNLEISNRIIRFFRAGIPVIFGLVIYHTMEIAKNETNGLGIWLLISSILILNIPNLYYAIKFISKKPNN
jgi:uncharacterized membrane protein